MCSSEHTLPVYLIHFNRPLWCSSAAASVLGSQGVRVELCVVDNGQVEGPPLSTVLPEGVRILRMLANCGYTGGANVALRDWQSRWPDAEYCVVASHDLHVEFDTLAKLVSAAREQPALGIVAPALVSQPASSGGKWTNGNAYLLGPSQERGIVERDWASGTCLLLRAGCVRRVGEFDEAYGSYVEDVDYCLRAGDVGWKVGVVLDAVAWGLGSGSDKGPMMSEANMVLLIGKRAGKVAGGRALVRLIGWAVRSIVGTISFWRSQDRRRESFEFARRHVRALQVVGRSLAALAMRGRDGVT